MGLCCFAFVITLHTYLKLIELISDKAVCSRPAGFLSAGILSHMWHLGACSLAFGVTVGEGSLRRAGRWCLSALHFPGGVWSRGLLQSDGC